MEHSHIIVEIEPASETATAPGLEELGVDRSTAEAENELEPLGMSEASQRVSEAVTAIATSAFSKIEESVSLVATGFKACMEQTSADTGTIEFGITLNAEAGVVVKAGGDANFRVSLTWNRHSESSNQ
jgi:hypothetical protein